MKRYLIYTLKRFVPLFAISFAIFFSMYLSTFSSVPYYYVAQGGNVGQIQNNPSLIIIISIPLIIFTSILPFMANSYRYSLKGADFFYQIGKGKKQVRYYNNLVLLSACLISFTVAYFLGVLVMILKQLPTLNREPEAVIMYGENVYRYYFAYNYAYFIPVYFALLIVGILNYAISYFFITRANNVINSVITLVLGHLILGIGLMSPFWYATMFANLANPDAPVGALTHVSSFLGGTHTMYAVGPIALIVYLFTGQISGNEALISVAINNFSGDQTLSLILSIVSLVLYFAVGVVAILFFIKEKESSGEYCGRAPGRDKFQIIIFHIGFGLIGLWVSVAQSSVAMLNPVLVALTISETVFFGAIYYVFLGLLRRNFRLNIKELIILISSSGINLILSIVVSVLATTRFIGAAVQ